MTNRFIKAAREALQLADDLYGDPLNKRMRSGKAKAALKVAYAELK
jgi:hypothetical protein